MPPRRSAQPPQPPDVRQFRTIAEIDSGITKLKRRAADLQKILEGHVRHDDDQVDNVQHQIRDTILEIFGKDSQQFQRHAYFKIDDGPRSVRLDSAFGGYRNYEAEDQQWLVAAIPGAITRVEGLIRWLEEKRGDLAEPTIAPRIAFEGRTLNPAIAAAAERLYKDRHYAQAVFEAGKTLIDLVKTRSGRSDLDGAPLMQMVFSVNDPILAFNDRSDQTDKDEQRGMMEIYSGAALGVRNPGGHRVGVTERPDRALQYIELFSLLADRLDDTTKLK
jgi:uncharacterized protein (TIGR02391 family)